jgi:hypothetical protein
MSCSTTITVCAGQRGQQFGRALGLVVRHARDRFVHQQHARVLHQQHADLQPLLLSVRQGPGHASVLFGQADQLQHLVDALALLRPQPEEQRPTTRACPRPSTVPGSRTP